MRRNRASQQESKQKASLARPTDTPELPHDFKNRWPVFALALGTLLLSLPIFAPWSSWPLAYVVFVPWMIAVCLSRQRWPVYASSYLLGVVFYLIHLRWMRYATPEGYVASILLYLGLSFPLAAWLIRHLYRRRGLCLTLVFPIVWIAVEWQRAHGPLAFPWFLLGHTQVRLLTLIQIADIGGAYVVSFVVAVVNGWLADRIIWALQQRCSPSTTIPARIPLGAVATVLVLGMTILYGWYQLNQRVVGPGPRLAVLQGDFLLTPTETSGNDTPTKKALYRDLLATAAGRRPRPDMLVMPETPWPQYLNREVRQPKQDYYHFPHAERSARASHQEIRKWVEEAQAALVVGGFSLDPRPLSSWLASDSYNSAFFYRPGVEEPGRYNKIHLVPFGEVVPFRDSEHFRWLYRFLNDGPWNPWGQPRNAERGFRWPTFPLNDWKPFGEGGYDYSMSYGQEYKVFEFPVPSLDQRPSRFGITICYEDVVPSIFRRFVLDEQGNKQVDFMLNISNDGWFGYSTQQAQHLVACAFRAVENRVPIARAVNTGISGFVQSDGSWHNIVSPSPRDLAPGGSGVSVDQLPPDPRVTVYSRIGDAFAVSCVLIAVVGVLDAMAALVFGRRRPGRQGTS